MKKEAQTGKTTGTIILAIVIAIVVVLLLVFAPKKLAAREPVPDGCASAGPVDAAGRQTSPIAKPP